MMIFGLIIIGVILYVFLNNNRSFPSEKSSNNASIELLKKRYVNGEIDDETYIRMMKVIND